MVHIRAPVQLYSAYIFVCNSNMNVWRLEGVFLGVDHKAELSFTRHGWHSTFPDKVVLAIAPCCIKCIILRHIRESIGPRPAPYQFKISPCEQLTTIHSDTDTCLLTAGPSVCYAQYMSVSDQELLHHLSRMPFVDTAELAMILGESHVAIHRGLAGLLADGIVERVSHGTAHLPSSRRYYLTTRGVGEAAGILGFDTPSEFLRTYPVSKEWLTLLIRRMDAVASVYRLAASLSPGSESSRWGMRVTANHAGGIENAHP